MINVNRRRYYDGYELALCERTGLTWNTDHISVPSAPNPDKSERKEFVRVDEKRGIPGRLPYLGLYDEWIARSRLR